jgi:methionine-S-sulfoxide reductase
MRTTLAAFLILLIGPIAVAQSLVAQRESSLSNSRTDSDARPRTESAVFAGGCFWCTELAFEQLKGVIDVESGYCGGTQATANYAKVHKGATRHAEAIRVTFEPERISYDQLLDVFFDAHDPTQLNRQGEDDVGRHYRSAIFFADNEQKKASEDKIKRLQRKNAYGRRIVTRLEPLEAFYPAEDYHQDYARQHP